MLIEVQSRGFEKTVEVPVPVVPGVRAQLEELPEGARLQANVAIDRRFDLAETILAREKPDLRIEAVSNLRVSRAQAPLFRVM